MKRHTALLTAAVAVAGLAVVVSGALADQLMAQDEPPAPPFAFEGQGPDGPRMGRRGHQQGPLTRDQVLETARERFDRHDTDGNGEVSAEEVSERIQERATDRVTRGFGRRDTNDDGVITSAEMQAQIADHFDLIDTNNDGVITDEERRQLHEALMVVSGHPKR